MDDYRKQEMKEIILLEFPRISVFEDIIPQAVCDNTINKYKDNMYPYAGLESREQTHGQITEEVEQRSISEATDTVDQDYFKKLLAQTVGIPESHIEAGDIYKYDTGQYFSLHHDYPYNPLTIPYYSKGGDRKATAIFWLNDDYEGGQCTFPELGVTVQSKQGGFLYFEYDYPDENDNLSTIHESLVITKGTKWIAAFFIANGPRVE
jgi:prolyl 4-hydroxylase